NDDGTFNYDAYAERAKTDQVKMIEIKLSQGAKPGHGGMLPAKKVTAEVARIRLVPEGKDVLSPPAHSAFNSPIGLLEFVKRLRDLSDGKPVGFKLCIGRKSEFYAICKAMIETGIYPDFITVDGGEGGTGAAPQEFSNSVGMPLREGVAFVYDVLNGFDLKKHIKIIASGKNEPGIYHYCNEGIISWYDFAVAIQEISKTDCTVNAITTTDYPTPAKRPHYSALDTSKIRNTFNLDIPAWRSSLEHCIGLL
ncbi:MAG: hypothetical protein EOO88_60830, partial [Pedobacter sp.]